MKKLTALLLSLLLVLLLTGCPKLVRIEGSEREQSAASSQESPPSDADDLPPLPTEGAPTREPTPEPTKEPTPEPTPEPTQSSLLDGTASWRANERGSAVLLEGKTLLISLYVDDTGTDRLTDVEITRTRKYLRIAAEYLEAVGAEYGCSVDLLWEEDDLAYDMTVDCDVADGENSSVNESIFLWINAHVDSDALLEKYGADGIGYLLFVNCGDISYTMPYYIGDGEEWFYERCTLFYRDEYDADCEPPAVYAHEILHLFGAPDLYDSNEADGVSEALVRYVEHHLPQELMYDTYDANGMPVYGRVEQYVSALTAYRVGLLDEDDASVTELLEQFPEFWVSEVGCFVYDREEW